MPKITKPTEPAVPQYIPTKQEIWDFEKVLIPYPGPWGFELFMAGKGYYKDAEIIETTVSGKPIKMVRHWRIPEKDLEVITNYEILNKALTGLKSKRAYAKKQEDKAFVESLEEPE